MKLIPLHHKSSSNLIFDNFFRSISLLFEYIIQPICKFLMFIKSQMWIQTLHPTKIWCPRERNNLNWLFYFGSICFCSSGCFLKFISWGKTLCYKKMGESLFYSIIFNCLHTAIFKHQSNFTKPSFFIKRITIGHNLFFHERTGLLGIVVLAHRLSQFLFSWLAGLSVKQRN